MESRAVRYLLITIALLQALALYALGTAVDDRAWPATHPPALLAGYLLATGVPLFIYLSPLRRGEVLLDMAAAAIIAAALFAMAWHTGLVLSPPDGVADPWRYRVFSPDLMASSAFIVFVSALLYRAWREAPHAGLPWRCQLDAAWGNALTLALVVVFVVLLWLLLWIWAALFQLIGIAFFADLFRERAFGYAVTGLSGGIGLVLVRSRIGLITAVRTICEVLSRVLLPMAALIVVGFTVILPFAGIELLWQDGGRPSALLWLAAFTLFFMNAALGDEGFGARLRVIAWLVAAALVALPILLVVTAYGLFQQVDVFGWSLVRLWALLVIFALLAYALAGAWSLVRHRALVPETIGRGNTALALALIALLIAVHTPLADLRRLAANDQFARVLDGRTPTVQFDAHYIGRTLGRYGHDVLDRLLASELADDDTFAARLEAAKRGEWYAAESYDPQLRLSESLVSSTVDEVPDDLLALLHGQPHLINSCWREGYECRVERVLYENRVFWFVYSELHFHDAPRTRNLQVSWVLWQRAGTWEQVGRLDRGECRPGNADAEPQLPAIRPLADRPGSVLASGGCTYPIIWRIEPEVMSANVIGRGR